MRRGKPVIGEAAVPGRRPRRRGRPPPAAPGALTVIGERVAPGDLFEEGASASPLLLPGLRRPVEVARGGRRSGKGRGCTKPDRFCLRKPPEPVLQPAPAPVRFLGKMRPREAPDYLREDRVRRPPCPRPPAPPARDASASSDRAAQTLPGYCCSTRCQTDRACPERPVLARTRPNQYRARAACSGSRAPCSNTYIAAPARSRSKPRRYHASAAMAGGRPAWIARTRSRSAAACTPRFRRRAARSILASAGGSGRDPPEKARGGLAAAGACMLS